VRRAHAREVVLLPNDADLRHTAAAAAEQARVEGIRVALIPTRSAVQGIAALAVHEPERRLDIDWKEQAGERFLVRLWLEGNDRRSLYADIAAAVSSTGTDIRSMELKTVDGRVSGAALVEVENLAHLQRIMRAARRVKGITDVARRERISAEE